MLRERAGRGIDAKCGDMMVGARGSVTGGAAAGRDIKVAPRYMRPGILHARRQRDRPLLDQRRARDIDVVVRELGSHVRIQRDLVGRLCDRKSGRRNTPCG